MDKIIRNPGLCHLSQHIFGYLDPWSFAQCRLVCKLWNSSCEKPWLLRKLDRYKAKELFLVSDDENGLIDLKTLLEVFPDWIEVFRHFETKESLENLEEFVNFMEQFYKNHNTRKFNFKCHSNNLFQI